MDKGNPSGVSSLKSRPFDSMGQAAAALAVSPELLKRAKRAGCPHFLPGNRIDARVVQWIAEHQAEMSAGGDGDGLKEQKLKEEVRKLRRLNDIQEGKLVAKSDVAKDIVRVLSRVCPFLEAKLVNEYPSAVAGLDVPQARVYGRRLFDATMVFFQSLAKEFPE